MNRFQTWVVIACSAALLVSGLAIAYKAINDNAVARRASAVIDGIEPTPGGGEVYCGEGSICKSLFTEPYETVILFFRDGSFMTFSTHDEKMIDAPISWLVEAVTESGRFLNECLLVVHNHFSPMGFSPGDVKSYQYLKARGFKGVFGIYYTATGRFVGVED